MREGDPVSVPVFGGGRCVRIVSQVIANIVVVSTKQEYEEAKREHRQPIVIGFKEFDVLPA